MKRLLIFASFLAISMAFPQQDPKNGLGYDSEAVKKLGESLNDAKEKEEYGKFVEFMKKFDRKYVNEEELKKRFGVFQQSLARAAEQQKKDRGTAVYGVSKFSDYTLEEFKKMNGARPPNAASSISSAAIFPTVMLALAYLLA